MEFAVPDDVEISTRFTSYPHPTVFNIIQMGSIVYKVFLVGLGGCVGSIVRYWLQGIAYRWTGPGFPYGTLLVNIVGCFFIGLIMTLSEERFLINPEVRIFIAIGILGGFTTFSSFSYETLALVNGANYFAALGNILSSVVIGLTATWLGMVLARLF